MMYSVESEFIY